MQHLLSEISPEYSLDKCYNKTVRRDSTGELESKIRELRQLQALIEEAEQEAEAIKDALKAHMGDAEELRAGEYKVT